MHSFKCSPSLTFFYFSMFSQQQASPQFTQQNNGNMYNSNGMNLNNVSMATNSMGQMGGQMNVTSMATGPSPSLPPMGQEQVITLSLLAPFLEVGINVVVGGCLSCF